jgi:uncharacterized RDD family membrane protein YckC
LRPARSAIARNVVVWSFGEQEQTTTPLSFFSRMTRMAFWGTALTAVTTDTAPAAAVIHYAGFWRRVLAFLIDHAIILVPLTAILYGVGAFEILTSDDPIAAESSYIDRVSKLSIGLPALYFGVLWLYYALLESGKHQATLGKRIVGIKVTDMEGRRVGFWRCFGRQLGKMVSKASLGIGFVVAAFTPKKQALHDLFSRCLVVCVH